MALRLLALGEAVALTSTACRMFSLSVNETTQVRAVGTRDTLAGHIVGTPGYMEAP
jgi:hypothetical protein